MQVRSTLRVSSYHWTEYAPIALGCLLFDLCHQFYHEGPDTVSCDMSLMKRTGEEIKKRKKKSLVIVLVDGLLN
jgi:hypothetical protein